MKKRYSIGAIIVITISLGGALRYYKSKFEREQEVEKQTFGYVEQIVKGVKLIKLVPQVAVGIWSVAAVLWIVGVFVVALEIPMSGITNQQAGIYLRTFGWTVILTGSVIYFSFVIFDYFYMMKGKKPLRWLALPIITFVVLSVALLVPPYLISVFVYLDPDLFEALVFMMSPFTMLISVVSIGSSIYTDAKIAEKEREKSKKVKY